MDQPEALGWAEGAIRSGRLCNENRKVGKRNIGTPFFLLLFKIQNLWLVFFSEKDLAIDENVIF